MKGLAGSPAYSAELRGKTDPKHTLVIGLIGLLCIVMLAVIYCKFFYKYCTACDVGLQRSGSRMDYFRRTLAAAGDRDGDGGVAYSVIKILPTLEFCKLSAAQDDDDGDGDEKMRRPPSCIECSICLSSFQDHDKVRLLPACRHFFHLPCIDTWLLSHATCPICRCGIFPLEKKCFLQVVAPPRAFPLVPANPIRVDIDII